jgi:transcriptional regulator with XRE-family HTH domain
MKRSASTWAGAITLAYRSRGMNRAQFQRAIGVAYSTVVNWERGATRPNAQHLERIVQVTGVPLGDIMNSTGDAEVRRSAKVMVAFETFIRSEVGLTADERRTLESVVFYGVEPAAATFKAMLIGLRLGRRTTARRATRRPKAKR